MKLKLLNTIKCDLNKSIINIGFAGAVLLTTVPAFFLSSFCKNPYIITYLPFMLNYVLTTMLNRIIDANLFNDNFDFDRANAFYPSSVTNFLYIQSFDKSAKWITAVNCSGAIVALLGFIMVMNLHKDKGV